jgi:hypothetical protein
MNLPKRTPEQKLQRVSQMRRLALSLREAYEKQFLLNDWLARFEILLDLPPDHFPAKLSRADLEALRAGFRENWAKGNFAVIVKAAAKLPVEIFRRDHVLAAYAGAAREQLEFAQTSS